MKSIAKAGKGKPQRLIWGKLRKREVLRTGGGTGDMASTGEAESTGVEKKFSNYTLRDGEHPGERKPQSRTSTRKTHIQPQPLRPERGGG